jgi:hypothetical protein
MRANRLSSWSGPAVGAVGAGGDSQLQGQGGDAQSLSKRQLPAHVLDILLTNSGAAPGPDPVARDAALRLCFAPLFCASVLRQCVDLDGSSPSLFSREKLSGIRRDLRIPLYECDVSRGSASLMCTQMASLCLRSALFLRSRRRRSRLHTSRPLNSLTQSRCRRSTFDVRLSSRDVETTDMLRDTARDKRQRLLSTFFTIISMRLVTWKSRNPMA